MSTRDSCNRETSRRLRAISAVKFLSAALVISVSTVSNTMHDDLAALNIEKDAIIPTAEPVITIEACQTFHITAESIFEAGNFGDDLSGETFRDAPQVLEGNFSVDDLQASSF